MGTCDLPEVLHPCTQGPRAHAYISSKLLVPSYIVTTNTKFYLIEIIINFTKHCCTVPYLKSILLKVHYTLHC